MQPLAPALLASPDDMNFDSERYPRLFCVFVCVTIIIAQKNIQHVLYEELPIQASDANFQSEK